MRRFLKTNNDIIVLVILFVASFILGMDKVRVKFVPFDACTVSKFDAWKIYVTYMIKNNTVTVFILETIGLSLIISMSIIVLKNISMCVLNQLSNNNC